MGFHPHPHLLPSREKELLIVIARPRFLRSWQSHELSFIVCGNVVLKKMRFSRRPVKDTGLLRMTEWVDEIAMSLRSLQ